MKYGLPSIAVIAAGLSALAWGGDCPELLPQRSAAFVWMKGLVRHFGCLDCSEVRTSCPLDRLAKLPEVFFVGERHGNRRSEHLKARLFDLARQDAIVLATEVGFGVPYLPWSGDVSLPLLAAVPKGPSIHGIESTVPAAITDSYSLQKGLIEGSGTASSLLGFMNQLKIHPLVRGGYENARKKGACPECVRRVDKLSEALADTRGKSMMEVAEVMAKTISGLPDADLRTFLGEVHAEVIAAARANFGDRLKGVELPVLRGENDIAKVGFASKGSLNFRSGSIMDKLMQDIRDRDFAQSVGNLLCSYSGKRDRIVVLVGDAHVERVEAILKGLSDSRLRTRYVKSYDPESSRDLILEVLAQPTG